MDNKEAVEFLYQSNLIEMEDTDEAHEDAIMAWGYAYGRLSLTLELIVEIHDILLKRLNPRIAGRFRTVEVTVGGKRTPHPDEAYQQLIEWVENNNILPRMPDTEDFIKQAHIDFEHIHPFEDGNGRVGRILLNWMRVREGLPILIIKNSEKAAYYEWFE